jgi:bifunctional non-homologous end joining protein LigD
MKVEITHQDKILFPKDKITKGDLIAYYGQVSQRMLPLIKDRPVSMERYPDGIGEKGFIQKQVSSYFPKWIKTKSVGRKEGTPIQMLVCNTKDTLLYVANQDCITPHIWQSTLEDLKKPTRMVFDLDPPGKNFAEVIAAAKDLRDILEGDYRLKAFVMTTGSKGLHVVVPIRKGPTFEEVRAFAKEVGSILAEELPAKYTLNPRKTSRRGKIFIDYMRNGYAQTAVAPYAVRALPGAPIAIPLAWKEFTSRLTAQSYTLKNCGKRLSKEDPWAGFNHGVPLISLHRRIELT